ncbi:hypothetical protein [Streptomyces sp. NPDC006879]|uniref:hypothetical protein n=1 Tax=Streptomyces sp. NPDC006879 TaxID=3364767 RepID=UPI0036A8B17B
MPGITGEQEVAEVGCPTPTVHDAPHCGHLDVTPACIASVLSRAPRIRRQCRDRRTDEQNTADGLAEGIRGPPRSRYRPRVVVRDHDEPQPEHPVPGHADTVRR